MDTVVTHRKGTSTGRRGWSAAPASGIAAGTVGIVLLVVGIVALARAGLSTLDLTSPVVAVGPFTRTALFGLIEIGLGLAALATVAERDVRGVTALAIGSGVAGIVWLIEPAAFAGVLGTNLATGWLYVLVAAALLVGRAVDARRVRQPRPRPHPGV